MKKIVLALFSLALVALSSVANGAPVGVKLVTVNQRSGSGTLSTLAWKECAPAPRNGCIDPTNPWVIANGVTGSTATWTWDSATGILASTGLFWATSYISSNPFGKAVISDRVVDLRINTGLGEVTASNYLCYEGNFLASVGANGCGNYDLGQNVADNSSVRYNVDPDGSGPNPLCVQRTLGGDDEDTGNPRGAANTFNLIIGCDSTDAAFDQYTIVQDDIATGGQLRLSNGICLGTGSPDPACSGVTYLTFVAGPNAVDDGDSEDVRGEIGVRAGTSVEVFVMDNDVAYGDPVAVTVTTPPAHGTAVVNGSPGPQADIRITYTPADNPAVADSFVYTAVDADGVTEDSATVTITPWGDGANSDAAQTTRNVPIDIPVGANDFGFGSNVTVTLAVPPDQDGTVTLPADGPPASRVVRYTPKVTAPGAAPYTETFSYQMTDGIVTDTAIVSVRVKNNVPVAPSSPIKITTQSFAPGAISNKFNAGLPRTNLGNAPAVVMVTAQGAKGVAEVNGTEITYRVTDPGFFTGTDTFEYSITDSDPGTPETATGTLTVTIADVTPAVADGSITTPAGTASLATPLVITLGNGSPAQHVKALSTQAAHGTCALSVADASVSSLSTVTYTPAGGYIGDDFCEVTITDGDGDSDTGRLNITVEEAGGGSGSRLPPSSGSLDLWSLSLLASVSWLRRKRLWRQVVVQRGSAA